MPNVFKQLGEGAGIFRNEDALSPEFLPETLPGREAQETELALALKPATEGGRPANCFVTGPSGTGKTSTCRRVLEQLEEYSGRAFCVYANCWQNSTEQAVLSLVASKAGAVIPRRGWAADEIFDRALQQFKAKKTVPVIILDEADRLFFGGEEKILYRLSRAGEQTGVHFATVLVTNDKGLLARADQRIRSSFAGKQIFFKPYSPTELKKILSYRAKLALASGSFDEEIIAFCAAHGAKNGGDARAALQALWLAGKNAEGRGAEKIVLDDVRKAMGSAVASRELKQERDAGLLGWKEKQMLELVAENANGIEVGELYAKYIKKFGGGERTLRNYLRELEFKGLVEVKTVQGGGKLARKV